MEFLESFITYQDNFLPFDVNPTIQGVRFNQTTTAGFHYRKDYLTPYWNPEGGFRSTCGTRAASAMEPATVGMQKLSSQFSFVQSRCRTCPSKWETSPGWPLRCTGWDNLAVGLPSLRRDEHAEPRRVFQHGRQHVFPRLRSRRAAGQHGLGRQRRMASSGGSQSPPLRLRPHHSVCNNIDVVPFYDVGNVYTYGHSVGPTAHAVGTSFRFDVSWFSFVERTLLRFDIAKTLNVSTPVRSSGSAWECRSEGVAMTDEVGTWMKLHSSFIASSAYRELYFDGSTAMEPVSET